MGGFLAELGKKLAERWLSLLVIPGLLYVGALVAAQTLGHLHPFDIGRLTRRLDDWATLPGVTSTSGLVLVLLAILLTAAGAGVTAQTLGSLTERVWLAERWQSWPPPLRRLAESRTRSRVKRWTAATENYRSQRNTKSAQRASRAATPAEVDLGEAHLAMTRIAQEEPARPSWIGDRVHAVITRVDRDYDLDLATVWPHLWLAMPETTRTEITAARESLARAATLAGWGLLYLIVGTLWWPGLLIAVAIVGTAWRRARTATDVYALLIEAAARLAHRRPRPIPRHRPHRPAQPTDRLGPHLPAPGPKPPDPADHRLADIPVSGVTCHGSHRHSRVRQPGGRDRVGCHGRAMMSVGCRLLLPSALTLSPFRRTGI